VSSHLAHSAFLRSHTDFAHPYALLCISPTFHPHRICRGYSRLLDELPSTISARALPYLLPCRTLKLWPGSTDFCAHRATLPHLLNDPPVPDSVFVDVCSTCSLAGSLMYGLWAPLMCGQLVIIFSEQISRWTLRAAPSGRRRTRRLAYSSPLFFALTVCCPWPALRCSW
jgi:hypothetical protein